MVEHGVGLILALSTSPTRPSEDDIHLWAIQDCRVARHGLCNHSVGGPPENCFGSEPRIKNYRWHDPVFERKRHRPTKPGLPNSVTAFGSTEFSGERVQPMAQ